jgi:AcrR family transcriptional regulator
VTGTATPRRRLTAQARKSSILAAARRAFTETGDMNGTTIKLIAERSGISEGVIYRHFESKDQLFFEAVVEPLKKAVDDLVTATEVARVIRCGSPAAARGGRVRRRRKRAAASSHSRCR